MRSAAAWVLERTLTSQAPADTFLEGLLSRFEERDQALLQQLVLGSLTWLRRLDHVIGQASNRTLDRIEPELLPLLRIGAYQLLFLDRVPAYAAVDEAVEQALQVTHRGGASFTNAVLRRVARSRSLLDWPVEEADPARRLAIESSHPDFLVERWLERFGLACTRRILDANNHPKPMQLLAFRDRGGRELLAESLIDAGLGVEPCSLSVGGLTVRHGNPLSTEAFRRGDLYIQDEASQAAALIPPPEPGERILDAAAAPGGKGFTLLALEPEVRLVLSDISLERLETVRQNLRRLRRQLPVVAADAARPPFSTSFDRVVLDLPCTGTGTLRKNPELKWRISEGEVGRLAGEAFRLLNGCAPLVRPGGLLVAITCSLEAEENEEVVARFLEGQEEFSPLVLEDLLGQPVAKSVRGPGFWRILPEDDHDGFTVHVLVRRPA